MQLLCHQFTVLYDPLHLSVIKTLPHKNIISNFQNYIAGNSSSRQEPVTAPAMFFHMEGNHFTCYIVQVRSGHITYIMISLKC